MTDNITLDTKELDRILRDTKFNAQKIVTRLAFQIEGRAKMLAPIDTGALRNSIYTVTPTSDNFNGAVIRLAKRSQRKGRGKSGRSLSSIAQQQVERLPKPSSAIGAVVGSPMSYAAPVEYGTYKMGSRPFLRPAVETIAYLFNSGETWRELTR